MNFILKLFKPLLKRRLKKELVNTESRANLIKLVNGKIDIPKLTEEEEAKLFGQIYDVVQEHALTVIDRL